jgi:hypothetical protein
MTLMIGLHQFFLEMSKKCWPRFRVRNSTLLDRYSMIVTILYDQIGRGKYLLRIHSSPNIENSPTGVE